MNTLRQKFLIAALAGSSVLAFAADPYKVTIPTPADDLQGAMVYLVNYDTGARIDSTLVDGPETVFAGTIEEPALVRLLIDGNRAGTFILENGSIVLKPEQRLAFGSPLNDRLNDFNAQVQKLSDRITPDTPESESAKVFDEYEALINRTLEENIDNPIGYYLFINEAGQLSGKDFKDYLAKYPVLARYQRVQKLQEMMGHRDATQPGNKYLDFSISQSDGKVLKLSDFVKPGKYTLVDFWASWCGPCIHEIGTLKSLWEKYHADGRLDIVGVAVWDQPDDTRAAIARYEIPWPCILNAQNIPTDLYGISGIPCIILIGPDGTILSRDKQDAALVADVERFLNEK